MKFNYAFMLCIFFACCLIKFSFFTSQQSISCNEINFKNMMKKTDTLPYVTGDTFKLFSHYVYDEFDRELDGKSIRNNSIVFVNTDFLNDFVKNVLNKIEAKFILITHNSDLSSPNKFKYLLNDARIKVWFGLNPDYQENSKFVHIPLGLINAKSSLENTEIILNSHRNQIEWSKRSILLYVNFKFENNAQERKHLIEHFKYFPNVKLITERITRTAYFNDLRNSKFVLCPPGTGLDTHRFYESILMGAIPIVKNSTLYSSMYANSTAIVLKDLIDLKHEMLIDYQKYVTNLDFSKDLILMQFWLKKLYQFI